MLLKNSKFFFFKVRIRGRIIWDVCVPSVFVEYKDSESIKKIVLETNQKFSDVLATCHLKKKKEKKSSLMIHRSKHSWAEKRTFTQLHYLPKEFCGESRKLTNRIPQIEEVNVKKAFLHLAYIKRL